MKEIVSDYDLAYFSQRFQCHVFDVVISAIIPEIKSGRTSVDDISERMEVRPEQVRRLLCQPRNYKLETISKLLLAVGAEMKVDVVFFEDMEPEGIE